ncbi:hypothetical protein C1Y63_00990 [Corynebacterium sp. 13CS0277]|uniref:hypothetical protein n=1 Tax=Corynebacterium sp. 13CS0277 TaxID=2071994 RepID=UPI000D03D88E|nr:hypothetical protein [Corynebacterium sp. 13CS0277]PRQ12400.1 hypothetical protein C1Y63_00990 [Corynebacterium sp. 13CS0277]
MSTRKNFTTYTPRYLTDIRPTQLPTTLGPVQSPAERVRDVWNRVGGMLQQSMTTFDELHDRR